LVKLIALTGMMLGEEVDVKPSNVLAGQSPEKTNLWLQMMFQAATSGVDSAPYVQAVLGGGEEGGDEGAGGADDEARMQQEAEEQQRAEAEAHKAEKRRRAEEKKRRQQQQEDEE